MSRWSCMQAGQQQRRQQGRKLQGSLRWCLTHWTVRATLRCQYPLVRITTLGCAHALAYAHADVTLTVTLDYSKSMAAAVSRRTRHCLPTQSQYVEGCVLAAFPSESLCHALLHVWIVRSG